MKDVFTNVPLPFGFDPKTMIYKSVHGSVILSVKSRSLMRSHWVTFQIFTVMSSGCSVLPEFVQQVESSYLGRT